MRGDHGGVAEGVDGRPELQVVGTEIVAPLRDAVGFVHHEQARAGRLHLVHRLGVGQLLGRNEEELELAVAKLREDLATLSDTDGGVGGGGLAHLGVSDGVHLVLVQCDQRRDHHRAAGDEGGGHLVDGRLPGPGRHDQESVVTLEDGSGRFGLAGPERLDAESGLGFAGDEVHQ